MLPRMTATADSRRTLANALSQKALSNFEKAWDMPIADIRKWHLGKVLPHTRTLDSVKLLPASNNLLSISQDQWPKPIALTGESDTGNIVASQSETRDSLVEVPATYGFFSQVTDYVRGKIAGLSKMKLEDARLLVASISRVFGLTMGVVMFAIFKTWDMAKAITFAAHNIAMLADDQAEQHPIIATAMLVYGPLFLTLLKEQWKK